MGCGCVGEVGNKSNNNWPGSSSTGCHWAVFTCNFERFDPCRFWDLESSEKGYRAGQLSTWSLALRFLSARFLGKLGRTFDSWNWVSADSQLLVSFADRLTQIHQTDVTIFRKANDAAPVTQRPGFHQKWLNFQVHQGSFKGRCLALKLFPNGEGDGEIEMVDECQMRSHPATENFAIQTFQYISDLCIQPIPAISRCPELSRPVPESLQKLPSTRSELPTFALQA